MAADRKSAGIGKGTPGPGRPRGVPNKTTASVKEALMLAFEQRGGVPALLAWADAEPSEFYKLWGRMLPQEVDMTATLRLGDAIVERLTRARSEPGE